MKKLHYLMLVITSLIVIKTTSLEAPAFSMGYYLREHSWLIVFGFAKKKPSPLNLF